MAVSVGEKVGVSKISMVGDAGGGRLGTGEGWSGGDGE